jgi:hypothetical protein
MNATTFHDVVERDRNGVKVDRAMTLQEIL